MARQSFAPQTLARPTSCVRQRGALCRVERQQQQNVLRVRLLPTARPHCYIPAFYKRDAASDTRAGRAGSSRSITRRQPCPTTTIATLPPCGVLYPSSWPQWPPMRLRARSPSILVPRYGISGQAMPRILRHGALLWKRLLNKQKTTSSCHPCPLFYKPLRIRSFAICQTQPRNASGSRSRA